MIEPQPAPDERKTVEIRLSGEYDIYRRDELTEALDAAHDAHVALLDFSDVPYIDSTAIGCLIRLKKRMSENGPAVIRIMGAQRNVLRILELTRLDRIFEVD